MEEKISVYELIDLLKRLSSHKHYISLKELKDVFEYLRLNYFIQLYDD